MRESNLPPDDFQSLLTHLGGVNRYDDPCFRLIWAQYGGNGGSFRSGGVWSVDEQYFKGYRDLLLGSGEPCWALTQWHDAIEYSSPEGFYFDNRDADTGLQILGEYPYSGRFEILYNLRWHEMVDGKLELHTMPLSPLTLELIIPIVFKAKEISVEKRRAAWLEMKRREEDAKLSDIERHLREKETPFRGAQVSFTRQGIRSTVIDKKMLEIQRAWQAAQQNARSFRLGLQTR
jgi:hypothetical protein